MLHYTTYIKNDRVPWVTFVHGAGGSSSIWFKQLRYFKNHFNVLLVDLRGHGRSKLAIYNKLKKYNFSIIGDDIIQVLDHLKITKSHFVGISLGTIIMREISERFPQRVQSMIMGGAVMHINLRGQILMRLGNSLKSILPYLILYKLFAFVIMPRKTHRHSRNLFINEAKKLYQKEFIRWFSLVSQVNPLLNFFRFKDSGIPTLYIMGDQDHMFLPSISKLVKEHQMSRLEVLHECGHVVNVEQPELFNQLTKSFIMNNT